MNACLPPADAKSSIEDVLEAVRNSCALNCGQLSVVTHKNKLTTKDQFRSILRNSTRFVGKYIIIDARVNKIVDTRLGMTVVRRFGKAHDRNRIKRQIREAFRLSYSSLCEGLDMNIRPRPFARFAKTQNIMDDLIQLVGRGSHVKRSFEQPQSRAAPGSQDS